METLDGGGGSELGPQSCSSELLLKGMGSGSGMACDGKRGTGRQRGCGGAQDLGSSCGLLCDLGRSWPRPAWSFLTAVGCGKPQECRQGLRITVEN